MELIDGKQIASDIVDELTHEVATIERVKPCIAFIRVGEDPASVSYVRGKNRTAEKIGIRPLLFTFDEDVSQEELFAKVDELNGNPSVNGILIQSPLPKHLNEQGAFNRIDPDKDVDGFHVVLYAFVDITRYTRLDDVPHGLTIGQCRVGIPYGFTYGFHVVVVEA